MLESGDLTGEIIGAAIAVHRELGPGFLEAIYEEALAVEFIRRGIEFQRQYLVPIFYRGVEFGLHRIDLFVADEIVVELKTIAQFEDVHFVIVRSYLKSVRRRHGLLLNFARTSLAVRRVISE